MKKPAYDQLREVNWRRKLTAAEAAEAAAQLAGDPAALADWEAELALSRVLEQLPAAPPVASNFTTGVLQLVAREDARRQRANRSERLGWWRRWLPRAAIAGLAVAFGVLGYQRVETRNRRALAVGAAEVYEMVAASPEWLEDFDAIDAVGRAQLPQAQADTELLALLQ